MQQYETGGLGSFQAEVSKLADLGRYEDAYIAHVAEGETVVPMEVLDSNPKLKAMLFNQMLDMGINPERYIVGNELNSINPVTGQPEFFLKRIFKGAKKALKSIAPYAGTIAGIMGAGPVYSALIGAGVPLLAGQDAGAAIAGGIGGYGAGKAFGMGDQNVFRGIFSGDTSLGDAFGQVQSNLGFGQDSTCGNQWDQCDEFGCGGTGFPYDCTCTESGVPGVFHRKYLMFNPATDSGWQMSTNIYQWYDGAAEDDIYYNPDSLAP